MLFFISDTLVKLLLSLTVFLSASLELVDTLISLLANDARDILQVVKKDLSFLLFLGVFVEIVDFSHVVQLLVEVLLRVNQGIEQVAILAILLRFEVE